MSQDKTYVLGVQEGIVKVSKPQDIEKPFIKNEVIYIIPNANPEQKIMCEILRVKGNIAEAQIFEPANGIAVGDKVEQSGRLLSVTLGPGLLGKIYDGLQFPLKTIATEHGFFLPRGANYPPLDQQILWNFKPSAEVGATVSSGDVLGKVQEGRFEHKIMVPFSLNNKYKVISLFQGDAPVTQHIAVLQDEQGEEISITMQQTWPVRSSIPEKLILSGKNERLYPEEPLITTIRMVDTFFPIAKGGTTCIPGPFGAGKTVLQNLISKYSNVDIVIVIACGERAGEVVETIHEFPELIDPATGGSLMDRTIVICNTSSMPVAAREASIYTGMTLGEYYRQMGLNVLVLADSTSRWAQAMRETAGRMEEIPGEEGFPAYLDSAIRNVYERAGVLELEDKSKGSLTLIGTVSPAGGNFEEPVTQSTLATVKTFLGLSYARAYKRFYPAIDPLISWSRYYEQLKEWYQTKLDPLWDNWFDYFVDLIKQGNRIEQMMQVTGEEGVSLEDFTLYHKAKFFDMCYLQQDAFDKIDVSVPIARQKNMLELLYTILNRAMKFNDKDHVFKVFSKLTACFKNLNYSEQDSVEYNKYVKEIDEISQ